MGINSRAKGRRGEMMALQLIRGWWKEIEPEAEFARTPLSGGWQGRGSRGQSLRGEMRMSGDLMTTSRHFPFSVEVKNNPSWTIKRVLEGKSSVVWDWWQQCQTAAKESGLVPMLWIKRWREQWKVMLPYRYAIEIPIQPPFAVWSERDLWDVQYGEILPILFDGRVVLSVNPALVWLNDQPNQNLASL